MYISPGMMLSEGKFRKEYEDMPIVKSVLCKVNQIVLKCNWIFRSLPGKLIIR
jgi:hypothetical protein